MEFIVILALIVLIVLLLYTIGKMVNERDIEKVKYRQMHELGLLMLHILELHEIDIEEVNKRADELLKAD